MNQGKGVQLDKVKGCGVLPVARAGKGSVMFLLGREQMFKGWKGSGKYADFGGGIDKGENVLECAAREGYEESMGFLGSKEDIRKKVVPGSEGFIDGFIHPAGSEHMVIAIKIYYNKYMPSVFKDVFEYITRCAKKIPEGKYVIKSCPEGYLEKDEVRWFGYDELKKMVENEDNRLRPYFARCLKVMFNKYGQERDMIAKWGEKKWVKGDK